MAIYPIQRPNMTFYIETTECVDIYYFSHKFFSTIVFQLAWIFATVVVDLKNRQVDEDLRVGNYSETRAQRVRHLPTRPLFIRIKLN